MDRKTKGRLAEVKVISYLIENGYEIYLPFSNNSKYDCLAYKDSLFKRISIKYTSVKRDSGSWQVELRQIYRGNNTIKIHKFDNSEFDLLAVYIAPEEKVILIDTNVVKTRSISIRS